MKRTMLVKLEVPTGMGDDDLVKVVNEAMRDAGEDIVVATSTPIGGPVPTDWPGHVIVGFNDEGKLLLNGPFWSKEAARDWYAEEVATDNQFPTVLKAAPPTQQWRVK